MLALLGGASARLLPGSTQLFGLPDAGATSALLPTSLCCHVAQTDQPE